MGSCGHRSGGTFGRRHADAWMTEKPARARLPALDPAARGRRRDDVRILEDWQGDPGAEVREPIIAAPCACSEALLWACSVVRAGWHMGTSERARERGACTWRLTVANSELAREKMWSRIHLIPLLTAEEDRDLVRRHLADQKREKELLGSETSPYNSDK